MKKIIPLVCLCIAFVGCDIKSPTPSGTWTVCWRSNTTYFKILTHNKPSVINDVVYIVEDDGKQVIFSGNWYVEEN